MKYIVYYYYSIWRFLFYYFYYNLILKEIWNTIRQLLHLFKKYKKINNANIENIMMKNIKNKQLHSHSHFIFWNQYKIIIILYFHHWICFFIELKKIYLLWKSSKLVWFNTIYLKHFSIKSIDFKLLTHLINLFCIICVHVLFLVNKFKRSK